MVKSFALSLTASATRLSAVYGAGAVNESLNIPYRQLLLQATGAAASLGDATVTTTSGLQLAVGAITTLGPFSTGPVKLSDLYAVGAGATLQILGVAF